MGLINFISTFEIDTKTLIQLQKYCEKQGQKFSVEMFDSYDLKIVKTQLKAQIGRNIWNDEAFFPIIHEIDNTFQRALNH